MQESSSRIRRTILFYALTAGVRGIASQNNRHYSVS
jgi:hypothetical protein